MAGNGQEALQRLHLLGRSSPLASRRRRLLQEAVGDLAGGAAADGGDAGDRQQVLHERLGAVVVGALQRRQHAGLGERRQAAAVDQLLQRLPARDAAPHAAGANIPAGPSAPMTPSNTRGVADPDLQRPGAGRLAPPPARGPRISASAASMSRRPKLSSPVCMSSPSRRRGRGTPGRDSSSASRAAPRLGRDASGRREWCSPAAGTAPRPRGRRSGTAGRGCPRPTCRGTARSVAGSTARRAQSRRPRKAQRALAGGAARLAPGAGIGALGVPMFAPLSNKMGLPAANFAPRVNAAQRRVRLHTAMLARLWRGRVRASAGGWLESDPCFPGAGVPLAGVVGVARAAEDTPREALDSVKTTLAEIDDELKLDNSRDGELAQLRARARAAGRPVADGDRRTLAAAGGLAQAPDGTQARRSPDAPAQQPTPPPRNSRPSRPSSTSSTPTCAPPAPRCCRSTITSPGSAPSGARSSPSRLSRAPPAC